MPPDRLNPAGLFDARANHHSQGTVVPAGPLAVFSGQIAARENEATPPDLPGQVGMVVRNLQTCLDAVGATPDDIVLLRIYVTDMAAAMTPDALSPLFAFLGDAYPSMTGVGVTALAAPDLMVEIEMTVALPSGAAGRAT